MHKQAADDTEQIGGKTREIARFFICVVALYQMCCSASLRRAQIAHRDNVMGVRRSYSVTIAIQCRLSLGATGRHPSTPQSAPGWSTLSAGRNRVLTACRDHVTTGAGGRRELGLDEIEAGVLPERKARWWSG